MRRVVITLIAALPLALGTAMAYADGGGGTDPGQSQTALFGTITQVNTDGTFAANVHVAQDGGGSAWDGSQSATPVTISTDQYTQVSVDEQPSSLAGLAPGQRFLALFNGTPQATCRRSWTTTRPSRSSPGTPVRCWPARSRS